MEKIQLTQAEFDALPIHSLPPGREVATEWKLTTGGALWWYVRYEDKDEFVEIEILEIEIVPQG